MYISTYLPIDFVSPPAFLHNPIAANPPAHSS